ncbi:MAG: hypothetical protein Q4D38_08865, partial [Planctomycetia bacterium]|nr:hypothetical protein [Planctomycetia bacterium]
RAVVRSSNGGRHRKFQREILYTHRPLKFPSCATFCEPWCVAPTADGTGNFNEKYYNYQTGIFNGFLMRQPPPSPRR